MPTFCSTFLRTGHRCPHLCAQKNIDCPGLEPHTFPAAKPLTPPALSGSQLTLQLREAAYAFANAFTYPHPTADLLRTAADVIDRLTKEVTDLSSRTPRPFSLADACSGPREWS